MHKKRITINKETEKLLKKLNISIKSAKQLEIIEKECALSDQMEHSLSDDENDPAWNSFPGIYSTNDLQVMLNVVPYSPDAYASLRSLDELLEQDKQREADGFPRRIRIGKLIKPSRGKKGKVVVVPTTYEAKFYHDNSVTEESEGESTGGSGEGEEGEVIGEAPAEPQQGEGEGEGAGQGEGGEHGMGSDAFDLGKMLTEKFDLPNLKNKGKRRSLTRYIYDLTDRNRGFGQILDHKATLKKIIETNILLNKINGTDPFNPEDLLLSPQDHVYRILSKEKDFETQAVVFFLRDYSGSMQGKPTEVISMQHLFIYSWLMYQYQNNVETRFILHDTEAKEVPDFYTYHRMQVAGGTRVAPAFKLMNKIIEEEQLMVDYNIYVFYGTDGDDWDTDGKELITEMNKTLSFANRMGITVAKNSWSTSSTTTVEKTVINSGLLKEKPELIRMDTLSAAEASEARIIEGIKKLVEA